MEDGGHRSEGRGVDVLPLFRCAGLLKLVLTEAQLEIPANN